MIQDAPATLAFGRWHRADIASAPTSRSTGVGQASPALRQKVDRTRAPDLEEALRMTTPATRLQATRVMPAGGNRNSRILGCPPGYPGRPDGEFRLPRLPPGLSQDFGRRAVLCEINGLGA